MRKKFLKFFLIFLTIFVLLFSLPRKTNAQFTGIFDYFESAEGGVEEETKPNMMRIFALIFLAIIGVLLLFISSSLLQWAISHPEWLNLKNPIVESGLYFTTGLVNLFIILLFVAIAITWILKIETFAAKKALPKLILVALLVNFIPVIIGIPLDIATIIHKTILTETDLVPKSVEAIFGGMDQIITGMLTWMFALLALFIIPFVSPFAEYGFVAFMLTLPLFGPILLSWIIQTILAIMLSSIYFTLAFLFAARVYVIWFLTIAAPLAFLCLVLPQTEKYWKEWLQHLLDWVFFGLIVLLFLVVGLKGIKYITPPNFYGLPPNTPGLMWLSLPSYFSYYFFLFVFISIISFLSKKFSPQLANTLIAQGAAFTGMFMGGVAVLGKGIASSYQRSLAQQREREERAQKKQAEGKKLTRGERLALAPPVKGMRRFGAWIYRGTTGISVEEAEERRRQKLEAEAMKIQTPEEFGRQLRGADITKKRAFASVAQEKGKDFIETYKKNVSEKDVIEMGSYANRVGRTKEADRYALMYADKLKNDEVKLKEMGFKSKGELSEVERKEWEEKGYNTYLDKLIQEAKDEDIKLIPMKEIIKASKSEKEEERKWAEEIMTNDIQRGWGAHQYSRAAREFGREFIEAFTKPIREELAKIREMEKTNPEKAEKEYIMFAQRNPRRALYLTTTPAQIAGFESVWEMAPERIRKKYKNMKDLIARNPLPTKPEEKKTEEEKKPKGPRTAGAEFE